MHWAKTKPYVSSRTWFQAFRRWLLIPAHLFFASSLIFQVCFFVFMTFMAVIIVQVVFHTRFTLFLFYFIILLLLTPLFNNSIVQTKYASYFPWLNFCSQKVAFNLFDVVEIHLNIIYVYVLRAYGLWYVVTYTFIRKYFFLQLVTFFFL